MNDRYLYRAKRTDNGEWVEGSYVYREKENGENKDHHFILVHDEYGFIWREVDTSTLCQYTGLNDKNGQNIWENDIMCSHLDDKFPEDITYKTVLWRNSGFCTHEKNSIDYEQLDEFDQNNFEVCGNVFDNPELLEV